MYELLEIVLWYLNPSLKEKRASKKPMVFFFERAGSPFKLDYLIDRLKTLLLLLYHF